MDDVVVKDCWHCPNCKGGFTYPYFCVGKTPHKCIELDEMDEIQEWCPLPNSIDYDWKTHDYKNKDCSKLPKWAQSLIDDLNYKVKTLESENATLENMKFFTEKRDWFTLNGNNDIYEDGYSVLYVLNKNRAISLCALGDHDVIFIGRARKDEFNNVTGKND